MRYELRSRTSTYSHTGLVPLEPAAGFIGYRLCRRPPGLDDLSIRFVSGWWAMVLPGSAISDYLDAFGLHFGCPGCLWGSMLKVLGSSGSVLEGLWFYLVSPGLLM